MQDTERQSGADCQPGARLTVTVEEAGRLLGIGRNVAYESARSGVIPTLRLGKRLVVPKKALENLLERGTAMREEDRQREPLAVREWTAK